jgi:hypothetical protein
MSLIFRHALVAIVFAVTVVALANLVFWIRKPKPSAPKPVNAGSAGTRIAQQSATMAQSPVVS